VRTRLLLTLLFSTQLAHAQLTGRAVDSTNGVLPGVTVEAGGKSTVTGMDGTYTLALPTGTYDVSFQLLNFATSVRRKIAIAEGQTTRVDATLYLAASADVVVTAKQTFRNLADLDEPVNDLIGIAGSATEGVITAKEIERRPFQRAGEILETVPGVVVSQHSGEGKANQYYLRGFNLDHGTDIAVTVAGVPVNMPTHAHGQGYADANFLIPELIGGVQYKKGPYSADEGDFATAGAVNVNYLSILEKPVALVQGGTSGFGRALYAASPQVGNGFLLYAIEAGRNDGPWVRPDDFRKANAVLRYTTGGQRGGFTLTTMFYTAQWNSSDQVPFRAVDDGSVSRFGLIDPTAGGSTSRYSLAAQWQRNSSRTLTQATAYAMRYKLDLFSNFTYFLDDPIDGDQFEQADDRFVTGARTSHRWLSSRGEHVIGVQVRHDDIRNVGLYHTKARERLETIREDRIAQTGTGIYAQSTMRWTPFVRTIAGLRADRHDFGRRSASILSPKATVIFGPWRNSEFYVNAGTGFHSNDARGFENVTPLARTRGGELGFRSTPIPRLHATASLWALDMASELVFIGDAGTTEASRPSRRTGVELSAYYNIFDWLAVDADYAYSRARFTDFDPAGSRIPGAVEGVAAVGLSLLEMRGFSAELRYRHFGPRPLIEDDSVRSHPSNLVNARIAYRFTPRIRIDADVFNVLDAQVSDVDYLYTSRLPGEPAEGVNDVHFHPVEKRALRLSVTTSF
jgi:outer membrane cobalamin receptor